MIARYNNVSLGFGIPGLLMQIVGNAMGNDHQTAALGALLTILGTVLLLVGLAYFAKAKKRSAWWCLFALLGLIGIIVLACLKDYDKIEAKKLEEQAKMFD